MPTFGDYETVGEPVAITDEGGRVSTIWQAKKRDGRDNRQYAVKCFAPHQRTHRPDAAPAEDTLDADRSLEFLETVKQLKKARSEGGRCLAPIHAFGTADEGAWYVTDYCKRTLKSWIALRGVVVDAALRHVVHSLATGCLALQKSCGRSHGNLKVANVFLVGKSRAFREMPLELIDPRPASSFQSSRPGADDPGQISEIAEVSDLHAIGLIILQLVEGRIVRSEHDYNYPIANSPAWDKLGKESERWRQLCNQLLDPHLSLAEVNLESLAKQFRPSAVAGKLPMILGVVGLVCAVGVGIYFVIPGTDKKYREHLAAATSAYDTTNLPVARQEIEQALKYKPQDPAATDLKAKIEQRVDEVCGKVLENGERFLRDGKPAEAKQEAEKIFVLKNGDSAAQDLQARAEKALALQQALATRQQKQVDLDKLMAVGQSARQQRNWTEATNSFGRALLIAQELGDEKLGSSARNELEFAGTMILGEQFFQDKRYDEARREAEKALRLRKNDPAAKDLQARAGKALEGLKNLTARQQKQMELDTSLSKGQEAEQQRDWAGTTNYYGKALRLAQELGDERLGQSARNELEYGGAMALAGRLLEAGKYAEAKREVEKVLALRNNDPAALDLQGRAVKALESLNDLAARKQKQEEFDKLMAAGRQALAAKQYDEAIRQANLALNIIPGDSEAGKLLSQAKHGKELQEQALLAAQQEQDYQQKMAASRQALAAKQYDEAIRQANLALNIKPEDSEAKKLLSQAKREKGLQEQAAQQEQDYQQKMAASRQALAAKQYDEAIRQANLALDIKPEDSEAKKLLSQAKREKGLQEQAAQQEQEYQRDLTASRQALAAKQYDEAIRQANLALNIKPGDSEAGMLLSQAKHGKELQEQALLAAKQEQDYQQHLTASRRALAAQQYDEAILQADSALKIKPGDSEASNLKSQAGNAKDLQSAQADFQNGDYDKALKTCANHKGILGFETLAKSIGEEQKALADARLDTGDDNYTFIEKLKAQTYSSKPPFVTLLNQAETERKNLGDLRKLKDNGQWPAVKQKLSELTPVGFLRKAPFTQLGGWADAQAAAAEQEVKKLDAQFEVLLVEFNMLKAKKAKSPEAQRTSLLPSGLSFQDKTYYKAQVDDLIKSYTNLGWINKPSVKISSKNTLGKDLAELKDVIDVW